MAKFRSKSATTIGGQEVAEGATVEAHVVSAEERTLQAGMPGGLVEHLTTGDALVTLGDKSQHVIRAAAWQAQFEPANAAKQGKKPAEGKTT